MSKEEEKREVGEVWFDPWTTDVHDWAKGVIRRKVESGPYSGVLAYVMHSATDEDVNRMLKSLGGECRKGVLSYESPSGKKYEILTFPPCCFEKEGTCATHSK